MQIRVSNNAECRIFPDATCTFQDNSTSTFAFFTPLDTLFGCNKATAATSDNGISRQLAAKKGSSLLVNMLRNPADPTSAFPFSH